MGAVRAPAPGLVRQAWILFAALSASIVIIGGVGSVIAQDASAVSTSMPLDPRIFLGAGFALVLGAGAFRMLMLTPAKLDERVAKAGAPAHAQTLVFNILTWSITESMAIFGLVGSMLTGDPQWAGIGAGIALAAMLLWHRPRFGRAA